MLLFRSIHLCTNCPAWVNNKSLDKEPTARHVAPILSVLDRPLVRPNLVGAQYTLQAWAPESIPDLYVTFYDPCMCSIDCSGTMYTQSLCYMKFINYISHSIADPVGIWYLPVLTWISHNTDTTKDHTISRETSLHTESKEVAPKACLGRPVLGQWEAPTRWYCKRLMDPDIREQNLCLPGPRKRIKSIWNRLERLSEWAYQFMDKITKTGMRPKFGSDNWSIMRRGAFARMTSGLSRLTCDPLATYGQSLVSFHGDHIVSLAGRHSHRVKYVNKL